jgi:ABC-type multidrug transport system ATPase subunit
MYGPLSLPLPRYVPQEDVFVATQTAREALLFSANLKLGSDMPPR